MFPLSQDLHLDHASIQFIAQYINLVEWIFIQWIFNTIGATTLCGVFRRARKLRLFSSTSTWESQGTWYLKARECHKKHLGGVLQGTAGIKNPHTLSKGVRRTSHNYSGPAITALKFIC